jgi:hypothetical protein
MLTPQPDHVGEALEAGLLRAILAWTIQGTECSDIDLLKGFFGFILTPYTVYDSGLWEINIALHEVEELAADQRSVQSMLFESWSQFHTMATDRLGAMEYYTSYQMMEACENVKVSFARSKILIIDKWFISVRRDQRDSRFPDYCSRDCQRVD